MWFSISVLLTILAFRAGAILDLECDVSFREAFDIYLIVPQIIPEYPTYPLVQIFGKHVVNKGNVIPPEYTTRKPMTSWKGKLNFLYTLIAFDPDSPEFYYNVPETVHLWGFLVNIPGQNVANGTLLTHFSPPAPQPGSGYHRFVTLIYKQRGPINVTTELLISVAASVRNFSLTQFVSRYELGNPIAGNFFRSQYTLCGCDEFCGCDKEAADTKCTSNYC